MSSLGSYDANGNLTNDSLQSYAWDSDGNSVTVAGVNLTFDAFDRMVEQNRSGSYTQIVYGPGGGKLALMNGQTLVKGFAPLSAGDTAVYTSGPTLSYYRHADWLGSSRFASTPGRAMYYDGAYAPYGENYAETGTTDRNFTGQNQDTVSSGSYPLYDFLMREYHPTWGRWLSPDPAGLGAVDPTNPQSWNRYAYVMNNPTTSIDPTGQACYPKWEGDCASVWGMFSEPGLGSTWNEFDQLNLTLYGEWQWDGEWGRDEIGTGLDVLSWLTDIGGAPPNGLAVLPLEQQRSITQMIQALSTSTTCGGDTRVLYTGHPKMIGTPGKYGTVTSQTAAIIPSQFGGWSGAQLRPYANQIIGWGWLSPSPNPVFTFQGIDVIGPASARQSLQSKNPGLFILELYGASHDFGIMPVSINVPSNVPCPTGTSPAGTN